MTKDEILSTALILVVGFILLWLWLCPSKVDYWCPNESGTMMIHYQESEAGKTILESYEL